MEIAFFAARKIHQQYFSHLAAHLNKTGAQACVIWHKFLWMDIRWLRHLEQADQCLSGLVDDHLREKQNSRKGRQRRHGYWRVFRLVKMLEAQLLKAVYKQALIRSGATHVLLWNGLKFRQRIVIEAAKSAGLRTLVMENGLLPDMTTLDARGVNFLNSVPRDPTFFMSYSGQWTTKPTVQKERPAELPEHYIFIPFQVNTDSQIVLFSPWLKDMFALTDALLQAEQSLGERMPHIIMKTHPACDQDYQNLAQQLEQRSNKIRLLLQGDTQTLIQHAAGVATINSTVGIEAVISNINTLVLGQAFYNIPGLTLHAQNQNELEQQLPKLVQFIPNPTLRKGLLAYLHNEYQIPGRWQSADDHHIQAACQHLLREVETLG
ncbi:capsular polysaccharide export protein, LipB/KpsS family [Thalassolituus marinus]|uniref:Capsular biosynthesis protein n=1 Tax=Thalassolituus marinus TaxID=671053 RepID=A0ABS7ZN41_9GAMM|nr:hypothetical protein [Thalassolituus marinus]MCA6063126.1 hypothetical protein [Thalassolituus marinus]